MKTISTLVYLLVIISMCATSFILYMRQSYNLSALLTIAGVVSLAIWIKACGVMENEETNTVNQ